ncbi:MAG: YezD family protein [Clostridiales Family XIII bacterium]|nr:YezD family protein [Clostridiales Family XIII bacterium]
MLYDVISKDDLPRLIEMIRSTAYGSVTITIQDRKAVQIEKNEKIRIR